MAHHRKSNAKSNGKKNNNNNNNNKVPIPEDERDNPNNRKLEGAKHSNIVAQATQRRAEQVDNDRSKQLAKKLEKRRGGDDDDDDNQGNNNGTPPQFYGPFLPGHDPSDPSDQQQQQQQQNIQGNSSKSGAAEAAAAGPSGGGGAMNFLMAASAFAGKTIGDNARTQITIVPQQHKNKTFTSLRRDIAGANRALEERTKDREIIHAHPTDGVGAEQRLKGGSVIYLPLQDRYTGTEAAFRDMGPIARLRNIAKFVDMVVFDDPSQKTVIIFDGVRDQPKSRDDSSSNVIVTRVERPMNVDILISDDIPLPDCMAQQLITDNNNDNKQTVPVTMSGTRKALAALVQGGIDVAITNNNKLSTSVNGNAMVPQEVISNGPIATHEYLCAKQQQPAQDGDDAADRKAFCITTTSRLLTDKRKESNAMMKCHNGVTMKEKLELLLNLQQANYWVHMDPKTKSIFVSKHGGKLTWEDLEGLRQIKVVRSVFADVPPKGWNPFFKKKKNENEDKENEALTAGAEAPEVNPTKSSFAISVLTGPESDVPNTPIPLKGSNARALLMNLIKQQLDKENAESGGTGILLEADTLSNKDDNVVKNYHTYTLPENLARLVHEGPRNLAKTNHYVLNVSMKKHGSAEKDPENPN